MSRCLLIMVLGLLLWMTPGCKSGSPPASRSANVSFLSGLLAPAGKLADRASVQRENPRLVATRRVLQLWEITDHGPVGIWGRDIPPPPSRNYTLWGNPDEVLAVLGQAAIKLTAVDPKQLRPALIAQGPLPADPIMDATRAAPGDGLPSSAPAADGEMLFLHIFLSSNGTDESLTLSVNIRKLHRNDDGMYATSPGDEAMRERVLKVCQPAAGALSSLDVVVDTEDATLRFPMLSHVAASGQVRTVQTSAGLLVGTGYDRIVAGDDLGDGRSDHFYAADIGEVESVRALDTENVHKTQRCYTRFVVDDIVSR